MAKLAEMLLGPLKMRPFTLVRHTAKGVESHNVLIRILTALEIDRARIDAAEYIDSLTDRERAGELVKRGFVDAEMLYEDARIIEVLAHAVMDADKPDECWSGPAEMRKRLIPSETGALYKAYADHEEEIGPIKRVMTPELFEAALQAVAEEGTADPLLLFGSHIVKDFIVSTARELWSLRAARSSPISDSSALPTPS